MTMTDDIATLRRMIAEPTSAVYGDAALQAIIERYPVIDADHVEPDDDEWVATYDLFSAAADVWTEKAAALTGSYAFSADGASYQVQQAYQQALQQARYYAARRRARHTRTLGTNIELDDTYSVSTGGEDD